MTTRMIFGGGSGDDTGLWDEDHHFFDMVVMVGDDSGTWYSWR